MHVHFLDPYRPGASLIHRLDPRVKLALALAFIFTTALLPIGAWPIYVLLLALAIGIGVLSELGVGVIQRRSLLALPFMLAALPLIFTAPSPTWWQLPLGPWSIPISAAGIERLISVALKSWISVQIAVLVSLTTPFPDLLMALRALHIPALLVSIFALMWRYLFVLADEALRLMRARAARSGSLEPGANRRTGGSLRWRAGVTGGMAGNLFVRAFERSDRIYMAMVSRGFDGEVRALPLPTLSTRQKVILGVGLLILAAFYALAVGIQ
jgi:cobalt/nickel transport system permease protein